MNDLPEGVISLCKIIADGISYFSKAIGHILKLKLNKDLKLISQWAYRWKILFNADPTKQTARVCFSYKHINVSHQLLAFNKNKYNLHLHINMWDLF